MFWFQYLQKISKFKKPLRKISFEKFQAASIKFNLVNCIILANKVIEWIMAAVNELKKIHIIENIQVNCH